MATTSTAAIPRLAGAPLSRRARAERLAVFHGASVHRNRALPPSRVEHLEPGLHVVLAVTERGAPARLVELTPASALRLAASLLAATSPPS